MQEMRYKELILPKLKWNGERSTQTTGELVVEPLEPGFGVTLGNALRRVMLSTVEGSAITSIVIDGVNNEFSTLPGVMEDVLQLVLNIKGIVIQNSTGDAGKLTLSVAREGAVTTSDIVADDHLTIVNKDLVLCHLAKDGNLNIEFTVETGRGYVPAQWPHGKSLQPDGRIYIDSIFSPVQRVEYHVEKTRVGEAIDYDKLALTVTTNGAVHPKDVIHYATSVLRTQFEHFLSAPEIPFNVISSSTDDAVSGKSESAVPVSPTKGLPVDLFLRPIDELEFSVRAHNCLIGAGIRRVIDLVNLSDEDVLKIKNFGRKSLREVKEILTAFNLQLGMNVKELDLKKLIKEQESKVQA